MRDTSVETIPNMTTSYLGGGLGGRRGLNELPQAMGCSIESREQLGHLKFPHESGSRTRYPDHSRNDREQTNVTLPVSASSVRSSMEANTSSIGAVPGPACGYPPYAQTSMIARYIPEADPNDSCARKRQGKLSKRSNMLRLQTALAATVVGFNIATFVWATTKYDFNNVRGVATLHTGNCSYVRILNSALHGVLNMLSSLFLATGNYCMQILVAPSRTETDAAHAAGIWLEVGIQSYKNLWSIERRRVFLWLALGVVSSVLHLLWNSAIFSSLPFTIFAAAITTSDWSVANDTWGNAPHAVRTQDFTLKGEIQGLKLRASNFTRVDSRSCLELYVDPLGSLGDLLVVARNLTSVQNNGSSIIQGWINGNAATEWSNANFWVCNSLSWTQGTPFCNLDRTKENIGSWTLETWEAPHQQIVAVDHCLLGEQADNMERCGLHFSTSIMGVVCCFTLFGCLLVSWITWNLREPTMVTMGDAIASFLEKPEDFGMLEPNADAPVLRTLKTTIVPYRKEVVVTDVVKWLPVHSNSWFCAASRTTWAWSALIFTLALGIPSYLLNMALRNLDGFGVAKGISDLWQHGVGKVNGFELMGGRLAEGVSLADYARHIFLANSFQLLVSFVYLFVNNILSRQLVAKEWTNLVCFKDGKPLHKRPLRVSWPRGLQRSSYRLSMPFRYSVPLMIICVALHWMVSQSVFVVQTTAYQSGREGRRMPQKDASRIGYSTMGIILALATASLMILGLVVHSFIRKYRGVPSYFPRMGMNSAAIAAFCHPPSEDTDASLFPVSMGVVDDRSATAMDCDGRVTLSTWVDLQEPREKSCYLQPIIREPHEYKSIPSSH